MTHVALSIDDRFLRVAPGGRMHVAAVPAGDAVVLERVALGHDRVALRTLDGSYATMLPAPGQNFGLYLRDDLTPAAAFEEVPWPTGQVSFRSSELTYVAAEPDGVVTVNRVEAPLHARFTYVRPPGVVPAQRAPYAPAGETVPPPEHAGRGPGR